MLDYRFKLQKEGDCLYRKKYLRHRKYFKIKVFLTVIVFIILIGIYIFIIQFENEVLPVAVKVSEKYAVNIVSQEINRSVEKVTNEMKLYTGDFLKKNIDVGTNKVNLDVDTILINSVCNKISEDLSKRLKNIKSTKVELPVGIFSGIDAFSSMGPYFKVGLSSIGDVVIDYETIFQSVGINQINFQVYLKIDTSVNIINLMYKKDINISRKLMLVNTIFNGEVPNTYFSTSID